MMKFTIFVCLIVANLSFAEESPNPSPSPREESQPEQKPSQDEKQKTAANDSPTQQSSTFINQTKTPNTAQIEPNPGSDPSQSTSDRRIVWLTVALVFVGIAQVVVYVMQARYMRDGLEIAGQSAKAAQDSADAATKSAGIAEAALKLTERAYITVRDWQWSSPEAAHPGTISCFLVNNGRTPAQRISYFVHRIVDGKPANIPSDYRRHLMTGGQDMTIPAQDRHQIFVDRNDPLLPHYWGLVKTGATPLYAFTHIEYDDVFGERYEVGSLATYDYRVQQFRVHENPGYNYNRKKNA